MPKPSDYRRYLRGGQQGKAAEAVMNHDEVENL